MEIDELCRNLGKIRGASCDWSKLSLQEQRCEHRVCVAPCVAAAACESVIRTFDPLSLPPHAPPPSLPSCRYTGGGAGVEVRWGQRAGNEASHMSLPSALLSIPPSISFALPSPSLWVAAAACESLVRVFGSDGAQPSRRNDVESAIGTLEPLGNGFKIVTIGR